MNLAWGFEKTLKGGMNSIKVNRALYLELMGAKSVITSIGISYNCQLSQHLLIHNFIYFIILPYLSKESMYTYFLVGHLHCYCFWDALSPFFTVNSY